MPKKKLPNTRFAVIHKILQKKTYPSLEELTKKVSYILGTEVSSSSIEKDLHAMKQKPPLGCEAPISYSRKNKGFYYTEVTFEIDPADLNDAEWESLSVSIRYLYQYSHLPLFKHYRTAIEKVNTAFEYGLLHETNPDEIIHFEQSETLTGYQFFGPIYQAIQQRFLIQFTYENVYKKQTKSYTIQPCMLREHRNAWYVVGWSSEREDYLTFALDRIVQLETIESTQKRLFNFKPKEFLQYAVGIMEKPQPPQKVVLEIYSPYDRLLEIQPIHHSQKISHPKKHVMKVEMNVWVTEELCKIGRAHV